MPDSRFASTEDSHIVLLLGFKYVVCERTILKIPDADAGFFQYFTFSAILDRFAILKMAAGSGPRSGAVRSLSLSEQYAPIFNDEYSDSDLGCEHGLSF
jgi:hypothetical protein